MITRSLGAGVDIALQRRGAGPGPPKSLGHRSVSQAIYGSRNLACIRFAVRSLARTGPPISRCLLRRIAELRS
jgi:hypothetical protein